MLTADEGISSCLTSEAAMRSIQQDGYSLEDTCDFHPEDDQSHSHFGAQDGLSSTSHSWEVTGLQIAYGGDENASFCALT